VFFIGTVKEVKISKMHQQHHIPILSDRILLSAARGGGVIPSRDEGVASVCRRTTHVSLERKNLTTLHGVSAFINAKALFAYENRLSGSILNAFGGVHGLHNLHSLYLENNQISFLAGIESLPSLKKLYLQGNMISLVSSHLGELSQLTDLNLSGQKSPGLFFEPAAIAGLAKAHSLQLLDISNNKVTNKTLAQLMPVRSIRIMIATDNALDNLSVLIGFLCRLSDLERLDVRRNPLALSKVTGAGLAYQKLILESIALSCPNFCWLDGRDVEERYRMFAAELRHRKGDNFWSAGVVSASSRKKKASSNSNSTSLFIENVLAPPQNAKVNLPSLHPISSQSRVTHVDTVKTDSSLSLNTLKEVKEIHIDKINPKVSLEATIIRTNDTRAKEGEGEMVEDESEELGPTADDEVRVGRDDMTPLRPNLRNELAAVDDLGNTLKTPRGRPGPLAMAPLPMRTPLPPIESALSLITETSDENATATGLPSIVGSAAATMVANNGSVLGGEDREKLERALAKVSNEIRETDEADEEEEEEDIEAEADDVEENNETTRTLYHERVSNSDGPHSQFPASALISNNAENTGFTSTANHHPYRMPVQTFRPGSRSELRSRRPVRSEFAEVYVPLRTPSDFKRNSRFINSRYVTSEVRSEAERVAAGRIVEKVSSSLDSKVSDREMRHHIAAAAAGDGLSIFKSDSPPKPKLSPPKTGGVVTNVVSDGGSNQTQKNMILGEPAKRSSGVASRFFLKPVAARKTRPDAPESDLIDFGGALALHLLMNKADPRLLGVGNAKTLSPRRTLQPIIITGMKSRK
jgi:Leucine-rich repeat (LRR) protein